MSEEVEVVEPHWTQEYRYNGIIYIFVRGSAGILDDLVPEGVPFGSISTGEVGDDGEPISRQKTVREFVEGWECPKGEEVHTWYSPDGTEAMVLAAAMQGKTYRQKTITIQDAELWKQFATYVWGESSSLLTKAQRDVVLAEWNETTEP